jgi:hypothetical protein
LNGFVIYPQRLFMNMPPFLRQAAVINAGASAR